MLEVWKKISKKKNVVFAVLLIVLVCIAGGAIKVWATSESMESQSQADTAEVKLTEEQE